MFYSIVGASFFLGFFLACLIYERQLNGVADAMRQNQGLESEDLEVSIPTQKGGRRFVAKRPPI